MPKGFSPVVAQQHKDLGSGVGVVLNFDKVLINESAFGILEVLSDNHEIRSEQAAGGHDARALTDSNFLFNAVATLANLMPATTWALYKIKPEKTDWKSKDTISARNLPEQTKFLELCELMGVRYSILTPNPYVQLTGMIIQNFHGEKLAEKMAIYCGPFDERISLLMRIKLDTGVSAPRHIVVVGDDPKYIAEVKEHGYEAIEVKSAQEKPDHLKAAFIAVLKAVKERVERAEAGVLSNPVALNQAYENIPADKKLTIAPHELMPESLKPQAAACITFLAEEIALLEKEQNSEKAFKNLKKEKFKQFFTPELMDILRLQTMTDHLQVQMADCTFKNVLDPLEVAIIPSVEKIKEFCLPVKEPVLKAAIKEVGESLVTNYDRCRYMALMPDHELVTMLERQQHHPKNLHGRSVLSANEQPPSLESQHAAAQPVPPVPAKSAFAAQSEMFKEPEVAAVGKSSDIDLGAEIVTAFKFHKASGLDELGKPTVAPLDKQAVTSQNLDEAKGQKKRGLSGLSLFKRK